MLRDYKFKISYLNEDKLYASSNPKTGHYVIDIDDKENSVAFTLNNTVKMEHIKFTLEFDYDFSDDSWFFANGYQSWTLSKEYCKKDTQKGLTFLAKNIEYFTKGSKSGDYNFALYNNNVGFFHSFSYTYIRNGNTLDLFGSLSEKTGFTIIYADMVNNKIIIEKDLEGLTLKAGKKYEVMNIFYCKDEYNSAFDKYFRTLDIPTPRIKQKLGYTSWYNYYGNINNEIISRDLDSLAKSPVKLDIMQIDDGYQTAVGDWLSVDKAKFPEGMAKVAEDIHNHDMLAGLWLAPFSAQRSSKIAHEHKDWLIKDEKGYHFLAGMNWGGYYTLDIYNPEAREYIKNVFNTVLNEWKYDMVKLDFLFSVAIVPYGNKTRGQIMCDAVDFLRECCSLKLVLGCGVPLFPAFGKFDFCRIGADQALVWEKNNYFTLYNNEIVSTPNAVTNTIFRRHLDGRAFCNDPDVFLLRDSNIKTTFEQRKLLAKLNKIFGNLLFMSDNISEYNEDQQAVYNDTLNGDKKEVISAEYVNAETIQIKYIENGTEHDVTFNINNGTILNGSID
ncbi:MAG: alpha-galactosidase [Clostridia bacterium]|nr:alpha-galactosidase [Clostridia bacterium]